MATLTVDTDGVSGTYSNLDAALTALPSPFTEDMIITRDASTAVKDTTNATGHVISTTGSFTLTITSTVDYIYSPPDASRLEFNRAGAEVSNIIIDGGMNEKPSMTVNYQPIISFLNIRLGSIILKNCDYISADTITLRERMINLGFSAAHTAEISIVNNVIKTQGSSTHSVSTAIYHLTNRDAFIYNNTISGLRANSGVSATLAEYKNNIINTTAAGTAVSTNSDYNMFLGAFDFGGANDEQSKTFTFVDAGNDDYHLQSGDTGARGKGTDLSADANFPFDYDKDGNTRVAWDAGAYEFQASGTVYNVSITDSAAPTDSLSATLTFNLLSSDTASATDSYNGLIDYLASLSDNANPTDAYSGAYIFNISLSDTATPSDIFDSLAVYGVDISEIATAFDSYSSGDLIDGRMCVTISGVRADINITAISGQINITAIRPGIDITGEGCE